MGLVFLSNANASLTFDGITITWGSTSGLPAGMRIVDRYNVGDFVTKPFTITPTATGIFLLYEVVDDQIPAE